MSSADISQSPRTARFSLRIHAILLLVFYCLIFTLFGCGGTQSPKLSPVHTRAIEYNQKGMKAAERGDYEKALEYCGEALRINQSIENTEGIAVNLINMAVIFQKKGDVHKAHEFVDMALSIPDINDAIRSEAAYEKARLYLNDKDTSNAIAWINRSLSLNKGIREGSRWNLISRAAIIQGRYEEALNAVNTALRLNIENKEREDEANSLRLFAEIKSLQGRFEESKEFYLKALDIDKELGNSRKISITLIGIGELYLKQGYYDDAINYYLRAYNVSRNADDMTGTSESLEAISEVYRKSGREEKAEDILKDLEKKK